MNKTGLKGKIYEIQGILKQKYANLTDDDLLYEEGREEEFYGRVAQRIGKTKEELKRFIDSV